MPAMRTLLLIPVTAAALVATLTACGGEAPPPEGGHDAEAHGDGHEAPPAPEPVAAADANNPSVRCEAGATPQTAETDKGTEYWCDRDGAMHGPFLRMHKVGQKAAEGAYDNNLPNGPWIWWHPNGAEESKGKYNKGKQTGSWTWWYENGSKKEEGDYLQGRKQGTWTSYFDSARRSEEGNYHNGMKTGMWTYWVDSEETTVERTEVWENGQLKETKPGAPPAPAPK